MGYMHIENLYKNQDILYFKECYALEKIHGTSAHIKWSNGQLTFFSGGEKHDKFVALFNIEKLTEAMKSLEQEEVAVFGEAYGGKQQGQSYRYGKELKFIVFDVMINDIWLTVPSAEQLVLGLGLEFVHYIKVSTDLTALDAERDAPSEQAKRNGIEGFQPREGVVLRPLWECKNNRGGRIISKHKRDEERETNTPRKVADPEKMAILTKANDIAMEWVTHTRLEHVLDKLGSVNIEETGKVIAAMTEDILRESIGEIADSREARQAIGRRTAQMFKVHLNESLRKE